MDYYADINATLPSEKEEYFIDVINNYNMNTSLLFY